MQWDDGCWGGQCQSLVLSWDISVENLMQGELAEIKTSQTSPWGKRFFPVSEQNENISVWNGGLIKCYLGSIKTFCCYEIRAFWSKFVLWKRVDVLLCENNNNELHVGKIISKWKLKIFHSRNVHMGHFNLLGMLCFETRSSGNKILPELTFFFFSQNTVNKRKRALLTEKKLGCKTENLPLTCSAWATGSEPEH